MARILLISVCGSSNDRAKEFWASGKEWNPGILDSMIPYEFQDSEIPLFSFWIWVRQTFCLELQLVIVLGKYIGLTKLSSNIIIHCKAATRWDIILSLLQKLFVWWCGAGLEIGSLFDSSTRTGTDYKYISFTKRISTRWSSTISSVINQNILKSLSSWCWRV